MAMPTTKRRNASHSKRENIDSAAQRRTRKTVKRKPTKPARKKQRRPSLTKQAVHAESKQARIISLLRAPSGTTIEAMMRITGWQAHSVRGFMAGVVRKKLGLNLMSTAAGGGRKYWIEEHTAARTEPRNAPR